MNDAQRRGRLTLLAISALFITPIILATYLYFSGDAWRPADRTQHGNLITPPIGLPDIVLDPASGDQRLREVWSLLILANNQCVNECVTALEHTRQIRLSLGPKMTRMQTVFVPAASGTVGQLKRAEFPVLIITAPEATEILQTLIENWENGEIFLVDPLGNLMMSYPPGTAMGDVRKDLGHLLKLSGIG
jgi:hypothetical protein